MSKILHYVQGHLAAMTANEVRLLARASGVPFSTIQKIRFKVAKDPGIQTVEKLYVVMLAKHCPLPVPAQATLPIESAPVEWLSHA